MPLQGDADGTLITTADGTMQAKVSAAGMRLGGILVSPTAPGAVVPTDVDTSIKAPSGNTSPPVRQEVTIGDGTGFYYDASKADVTFNINLPSTLEYTIAQFGPGDKIGNPREVQPITIRQSPFTDGQITLEFAGIVRVTLIGLTEEQDRQIFSVNDLNKVFGAGTLT